MLNGPLREEAAEGGAAGGGAGGEGAAAAAADAASNAELLAQIAQLRSEKAESETSARYWHEQAKGKAAGAPAKPAATEEPAEDILELITTKGVKGLDELLAKRGFVRKEEVDATVNAKAATIAIENQLVSEYPELKDKTSEFFKATSTFYAPLIQDGVAPAVAMRMAAQSAELDGYKTGKRLTPAQKEERAARAAAQNPDKTQRTAAVEEEAGTGELDDFQRKICDLMEITPEQYQARAKEGVRMGGRK